MTAALPLSFLAACHRRPLTHCVRPLIRLCLRLQTATGVAVTRTRDSLTPPQLLLSTVSEGVLMVDARLMNPRRPAREPTEEEKTEGLTQYDPVLPLRHTWMLSQLFALPRLAEVTSSPTDFESTTHVAALGLDHFFARRAPAIAFDQLATDYNPAYFAAVIAACAVATVALKRVLKSREHSAAWQ